MELLLRSGITPASLSALEPDTYRGTAFEKRLLDAWYTGLFQAGRIVRRTKFRHHLDVAGCRSGSLAGHVPRRS
jgi:hypothetical protein